MIWYSVSSVVDYLPHRVFYSGEKRTLGSLYISISLISAAALAYEVLLMRLLSIIQWHHFAYMIISLALLGYGVSGTLLTLARAYIVRRFTLLYTANALLFGLATISCFSLAQRVPFNGLELIWNPSQIGRLIELYLLLALPFLFAANCMGLAFVRYREQISRIYFADLFGAGTGALTIVILLFYLRPESGLRVIAALGVVGAALAACPAQARPSYRAATAVLFGGLGLALLSWPANWTALELSQFKALPQTLEITGSRVIAERSSPLGLLTVVESPTIPFRSAPGLSLASTNEPPPQLGVFTDGDGMSVITRFDGSFSELGYLDELTSALPYHLLAAPTVLILGSGGGADVLQALYHRATAIDAVELNPQMIELVQSEYATFAGGLYGHPRVHIHVADARGFVQNHTARYDLIQVALLDSFAAAGSGTHALHENYIYTVAALGDYLSRLTEHGMLAITRWLKLPPRDALKLVATAVQTLERANVEDPARQLALIRSWQTTTLLIKRDQFSTSDIEKLRTFCRQRSFDLAYYPGMSRAEANQYNVLREPYWYDGVKALLGASRDRFLAAYKFNLEPATDERPYFHHFFKWDVLPELLRLREQGALMLLDSGYLILTATLVQAFPLSVVLVLAPLALLPGGVRISQWRAGVYFLCLGLAFLFVEIAFIQRFTLFVSHPLYAAATVLSSFLVFAGLGSAISARIQTWFDSRRGSATAIVVSAIALIALAYVWTLPAVFDWGIGLALAAKLALSVLLIAPLAVLMGMPFPLGLSRLGVEAPDFIPWAWGLNGCASVLSAILATLLAIHFGFQTVIVLAVILYLMAALIWR